MANTDYAETILKDVKTITGVADDATIDKLIIYIRNATHEIELFLGIDSIDDRLADIVQQMAVAKYRKEMFEGTKAASEEGLSFTYSDSDLDPFKEMLTRWQSSQQVKERHGGVMTFD
jgi:hypothetical protein